MTPTPFRTRFQREWIEISQRLGLSIRLSHEVRLGERKVTVPVLLEGFGGENGMLLVTDYDLISDATDEIIALGYGFSCLSEHAPGSIGWQGVEALLQDWGATF